MPEITPEHIRAIYNNLKESYTTVTEEYVKAQVESLVAGNSPHNVIAMMAKKMLEETGLLK